MLWTNMRFWLCVTERPVFAFTNRDDHSHVISSLTSTLWHALLSVHRTLWNKERTTAVLPLGAAAPCLCARGALRRRRGPTERWAGRASSKMETRALQGGPRRALPPCVENTWLQFIIETLKVVNPAVNKRQSYTALKTALKNTET